MGSERPLSDLRVKGAGSRGRALSPPGRGIALAAALGVAACATDLQRAEAQFADGRYPDAERSLAALEPESRAWPDDRRAEYALYRGLTLAALGDRVHAAPWLQAARAIGLAHPGALSREDRQRLAVALENAAYDEAAP